jgi:hypothetical protein
LVGFIVVKPLCERDIYREGESKREELLGGK